MQHKDRLTDDERKARRLASARKYREANREKTQAACREAMSKKRQDPEFREREKAYKKTDRYQEQQRQYRAENRGSLDAKTLIWRQANQDRYKAYHAAYQVANRHRTIARLKKWRRDNPERNKEHGRKWRAENPHLVVIKEQRRRARIKGVGGDLSPDIHARLMDLQRGKCAVCGTPISKGFRHLDHIMPISKGGTNTDDNVQLLCPTCNLSKSAKHPVDFMQERGFLL